MSTKKQKLKAIKVSYKHWKFVCKHGSSVMPFDEEAGHHAYYYLAWALAEYIEADAEVEGKVYVTPEYISKLGLSLDEAKNILSVIPDHMSDDRFSVGTYVSDRGEYLLDWFDVNLKEAA